MAKQKLNRKRALAWRVVFTIAIVGLGIYILATHWHIVSESLTAARHADISWLVLSLAAMVMTFCLAAAIYTTLAMHHLRYRETLLVEVAAAFANRLLPAGLGGLGLNGVYLYRHKHSPAEATAIVSVNNLLGMCAHLMLLVAVLLGSPQTVHVLFTRHHVHVPWDILVVAAVIAGTVLALPTVRRLVATFVRNLSSSIRRLQIQRVLLAFVLSVLLTCCYTGILYCSAHAVGSTMHVLPVFVIFSFGMLVGTAVPTPGGLVGTEAALFSGFIAYGSAASTAGAAVLLFRFVTYWLPLIPGLLAVVGARNAALL